MKSGCLVGQVEIEIGVGVLEGEDAVALVGQPVEAELAFLVGFADVVGCRGHR